MFLLSAILAFLPIRAWAQNCPELSGTYSCYNLDSGGYQVTIAQKVIGGSTIFSFQSAVEGSHEVAANDLPQPYKSRLGAGTVTAHCEDEKLMVTFLLTDSQGHAFHVMDTVFHDHRALARIRISLLSSFTQIRNNYVCWPVVPEKKTPNTRSRP